MFEIIENGPSLDSLMGGGKYINTSSVNIQWTEPYKDNNAIYWVEIYFTENFNNDDTNWIQIARIPSGINNYIWEINKWIKGDNCRVAIRFVDNNGNRSRFSISPDSFVITDKKLPPPSIFKPVDNATYFSYIPFVFDSDGIINCSNRAYYRIYYKSENLNLDWTLLYGYISINENLINVNTKDMLASDDYEFKIELVDEDIVSEPVFIKDITINSLNYFIIDTEPPKGDINIINNDDYINYKDIILELNGFDNITDVDSFRIEQFNIDEDQNYIGNYELNSNRAVWSLRGGDGVSLVQVRYKDVGKNVFSQSTEDVFRVYRDVDNAEVTSLLVDNDIWMAFGGSSPSLYKNRNKIVDLDNSISTMIIFNNILYFAVKTNSNKSIVKKYDNSEIITIKEFDENDSVINSMIVYDNRIFAAMQNGKVKTITDSIIKNVYNNDSVDSIKGMAVDNKSNLYLFPSNKNYIIVVNKENSNYVFKEIVI